MKFLPWVLSGLLTIALIWNWQQSHAALASKDAELATLRQQHEMLRAESNSNLAEANSKLAQAGKAVQAIAKEASDRIALANLREVQVGVGFRKPVFGSGSVAIVTNRSAEAVALTLEISRSSTGQHQSVDVVIDARQSKELGEREGWAFIRGDQIKVSQPEHKSLTFSMP